MLICSDNSTVVSYLNKEGGTHSIEMCALIWTRVPLQLPDWKTLLKQPHSSRFHNIVECLNLHVWLLDSRNPILEDSQLRWQKESRKVLKKSLSIKVGHLWAMVLTELGGNHISNCFPCNRVPKLPVHSYKTQTSHNYWLQNSNC